MTISRWEVETGGGPPITVFHWGVCLSHPETPSPNGGMDLVATHRVLSGVCWCGSYFWILSHPQIHAMWLEYDYHVTPRYRQPLMHIRAVDALVSSPDPLPKKKRVWGHWHQFFVLQARQSCYYLHRFVLEHVRSHNGAQDQEKACNVPRPFPTCMVYGLGTRLLMCYWRSHDMLHLVHSKKRSMSTRPFPPFGGGVWGWD